MISRRRSNKQGYLAIIALVTILWVPVAAVDASELLIGTASVSITPSQPVALAGQVHTRIAKQVESPVTATALAIETRDGEKVLDQAIMVSCDLAVIQDGIQDCFWLEAGCKPQTHLAEDFQGGHPLFFGFK